MTILGLVFVLLRNEKGKKNEITGKLSIKTNTIENSELVKIASQYILKKPKIFLNGEEFINWDEYNKVDKNFSKATPDWIMSQKSNITYNESDKFSNPYDYLNDKYIVDWLFIPGCEENPKSNNEPNWFDDKGHPCLGGYYLRVVINPDKTVYQAELNALD